MVSGLPVPRNTYKPRPLTCFQAIVGDVDSDKYATQTSLPIDKDPKNCQIWPLIGDPMALLLSAAAVHGVAL